MREAQELLTLLYWRGARPSGQGDLTGKVNMSVLLWVVGVWLTVLIAFCITCAIGALVGLLQDRRYDREVLSSATVKCPGTFCAVMLFYEPDPINARSEDRVENWGRHPYVGQDRVSSRLTSYPSGI